MKVQYDKCKNPINIAIGDKVMLDSPNRHKLDAIHVQEEPFIVEEIDSANLNIFDLNSYKRKLIHKNRVAKYMK